MNKEIQNKIKELRESGLGYQKISFILNISKKQVSYYCKSNQIKQGKIKEQVHCKYCGRPIVSLPHKKEKTFCSDRCRLRFYYENHKEKNSNLNTSVICVCCGRKFNAPFHKNQKFCSHECYISYRYYGGKNNEEKTRSKENGLR